MVHRHLKSVPAWHGIARGVALALAMATLVACDHLTALAQGGNPLASFASRCEALPRTTVEVAAAPMKVKRSDELSIAQLTGLGPPHFAADRTVGLTRSELVSESNIEVFGVSDTSKGRVCVRPRVRVRLAITPEVYIASEYHDAACRHAALVEHEEKHVAVYQMFLRGSVPRLRSALERALGNEVTYASSMVDAEAALKAKVSAVLDDFRDAIQKDIAAAQAGVDTAEEYARVDRQCGTANAGEAL